MALSLQARVVFPVDRPPIEYGVVTIDGGLIIAIGGTAARGEMTDLGSVAILPGLVNAHTHLEFSYLQQPLGNPGMSLVEWIRLVIAERERDDYEPQKSSLLGQQESYAVGATTIGDISTTAHLIYSDVTDFHEVIGFSRARAESVLKALIERIGINRKYAHRHRNGISPHAPYTVSPKLLSDLVRLAREHDLPMAMHLAESRDELDLLHSGNGAFQILLEERSMWDADAIPRGSRPLDYLRMLSEAPQTLIIHGNYLDGQELGFLGAMRKRMSLIYCPRTHAYFFHPPYPLGLALTAGVRVALGTDSRASNPDLSLLEEMRFVSRAHPAIDPHTVLHMGTLAGAEALGRDFQVGSITPGKLANLVAVPLPEAARSPDEMLAAILADESAPSVVYLAGHRL